MSGTVILRAGFIGHSSGALWIPEEKSLIIADVHLGYGWAQRRRGELGPVADERTRDKLLAVVEELAPEQIVFLGDLVHAPHPCPPEREWIESTLGALLRRVRLIAVRGNHDRAFAREFDHLPIESLPVWTTGVITAIHGDRFDVAIPEGHLVLAGHLHPSLPVRDAAGATQKLPVFLHSRHAIVLPAFSPFAGGYDIGRGIPQPLATLFRQEVIEAVAVSGKRAIALGPLDEAIAHLDAADSGQPARFRLLRRHRASNA